MAHLALFLPFQCLLQALVLQKTVLFMPVLYIIFGMPVDVMLVIGFYSWGMTWSFRSEGSYGTLRVGWRMDGTEIDYQGLHDHAQD